MRLLRFDKSKNAWVQLFSDAALDKYKNLSDLTNRKAARDNLELDIYYWNKESLENGTAVKAIHNVCIIQDDKAQFISQADRDNWNQKVDRPIVSVSMPAEITEGQLLYNPSQDELLVKINGKMRDLDNNRAAFGRASFSGMGNETVIAHNLKTMGGNKITPKFVSFSCVTNPQGELGETWFRKDDSNVYIGNTGSYKGVFEYMIHY